MVAQLPIRSRECARRGLGGRWTPLVSLCAALLCVVPAQAQDLDVRIWVAWGGGAARRWSGEIRVENGAAPTVLASCIREFEPVGLSPDESGSLYLDGDAVVVAPGVPRAYDAVRLHVIAARTAQLSMHLIPDGQTDAARRVPIPLAKLLTEPFTSILDERGNRLLVRRDPGDDLQVRFDRDSLVFNAGERFEFRVAPNAVSGVEADDPLVCTVRLRPARSDTELWEESRDARVGPDGIPQEIGPWSLTLPDREGVYDLHVTLGKRRLPTRFAPAKDLCQRSVQLVVVQPQAPPSAGGAWQVVAETQPQADAGSPSHKAGLAVGHIGGVSSSTSRLWKSLPKLPHWKWLPGSDASAHETPVGNGLSRVRKNGAREWIELLPGGWQAYPLPVGSVGMPHVVEIEYPTPGAQTLGISVVEPNAAGIVTPIGLNSGVDIAAGTGPRPAGWERHRLVFWPRTTTPFLLIANRRDDVPAAFGTLRVLNGPTALPARPAAAGKDARLLALYFDRPLLADAFMASDTLDAGSDRSLTDWVTFLQAGTRFVEYLKHSGHNGAMLSVWHEGGTIYPSAVVQSTPRYDSGRFFGTGQDPVRKDILEMLFRLFDREGLTLVPALQFSTPLPELETLRRRQVLPPENTGLELVAADGRTWRQTFAADRAAGPVYNPLSPPVQKAMQRVMLELGQRYGRHRSFGGVAVQLGPQTYAQLPDAQWAQDETTVRQFAAEERLTMEGLGSTDRRVQAMFLAGDGRERWLTWRARKLAGFYQATAAELVKLCPHSKLYLAGAELLTDPQIEAELRPTLPERLEIKGQLLRVGIDLPSYGDDERVVLLRPYRWAPLDALHAQAANMQLRSSAELDQLFSRASRAATAADAKSRPRAWTGGLLYYEPQSFPTAGFQTNGPFGPDKTASWLLTQIAPSAAAHRQSLIHSLATLDSQVLFQGGWTPAMGQHDALLDVADVFRQLPASRFETVPSSNRGIELQPVVVRRLSRSEGTYVYAVNDSPWPVSVTLTLDAPRDSGFRALGGRSCPPPVPQEKDHTQTWTVPLQPYDLVAAVITAPDARVVDWQAEVGREVLVDLRSGIDDLRKRANQLREPPPLRVLGNPDFELPAQGDGLPGWDSMRGADVAAEIVAGQGRAGSHALRLRSAGPVAWVRSNSFPTPSTGRLSVWVWLRIDNPEQQPPLQLAIEGRLDGQTYYRPARVGAGDERLASPPPLTAEWGWYLVRIDDLPTHGLTDLRVAIDLMGAGDVWIDDVQVFDRWFDKNERNELLKKIALANFYLGKGEVAQCEQVLRGYWPEFLRRYIAIDENQLAEAVPADRVQPASAPSPTPEDSGASPSWLKKMVPKPPKLPTWFR
ncbi:MAG: hypothetical protein GX575_18190 [Candidatus Anammoximicrobium sp.]|nr:hypothetical protein [Candidatus Anammoximicrobium sp.]